MLPTSLILHAGCGNSELALELCDLHQVKQAVAMDCSQVAIDEMTAKALPQHAGIRFVVGDVLEPLEFGNSSFDGWVDKGLIDAMMGDYGAKELEQTQLLLRSAASILKPSGVWLCVTLAQEHIVRLLVESVLATASDWDSLELHPLSPKSSTSALRPFALVLKPRQSGSTQVQLALVSGGHRTEVGELTFERMFGMIEESREAYGPVMQLFMAVAAQKVKQQKEERKSVASVQVKPWEADEDLQQLAVRLQASCNALEGSVTWKSHNVVPIGFGVSKLEIEILAEDRLLEGICEVLEEDEAVQSVDIDWEKTRPAN